MCCRSRSPDSRLSWSCRLASIDSLRNRGTQSRPLVLRHKCQRCKPCNLQRPYCPGTSNMSQQGNLCTRLLRLILNICLPGKARNPRRICLPPPLRIYLQCSPDRQRYRQRLATRSTFQHRRPHIPPRRHRLSFPGTCPQDSQYNLCFLLPESTCHVRMVRTKDRLSHAHIIIQE